MSLKFRIWSKKYKMFTSDPRWPNNQWAHEEFVLTPAGEVWCLVTTDNENYFRDVSDKYVVQRATGLKDVNDKEIYEGDIIKYKQRGGFVADEREYISVVEWDNKFVCFKLGKHFGFERVLGFTMGIVGNILENPELV